MIEHESMMSIKASEIIEKLQEMILAHGDLPVFSAGDWLEYPLDTDFLFEAREETAKEKDYGELTVIEHYPKRFIF